MSWGYYKCKYCQSFQQNADPRKRGICEDSGEETGAGRNACDGFRMLDEIKETARWCEENFYGRD